MPRPRFSYPGADCTIAVESSATTRSRWGFFRAIREYLRRLDLPRWLGTITSATAPNGVDSTTDKLMSRVSLVIRGIARIRPIDRG